MLEAEFRKNEATAGVALVAAAVADFTMYADHRLLEDEGGRPPAQESSRTPSHKDQNRESTR